ncbi:MAG: serine hydrolase [Bacteroidetes bacterium]|nr:serine hydrolase [Bacteroidota bacterium]
MKKILIYFVILNFCAVNSKAQSSYFPPLLGNTWDTISPLSLGWCPDKIDSLENYLAQKNTKAFIVLKQGKIALEKYFGTFTQDSLWYWASASKSLTGFLTGIAQEENLLSIEDTVSRFLGTGWTVCPPQKERLIKIKHQLSMTSGLDDGVPDDFCIVDTCLTYLADAGTRWAYHNAPYHLLEDVIANASGNSYNAFTTSRIKSKIGMQGLWYDYIFYSRLRDMARFGLLIQNKGIWNADTLLHDTSYFQSMLNSSQNLNLAYGYLWWLNGKSSFMLPQSQFVFQSTLIPNAPADAVAALGKNDQKIYVVPSLDLVVVRMGNSSGIPVYALSNFDNEVWAKLNDVFCGSTVSIEKNNLQTSINIFPNPAQDEIQVFFSTPYAKEIPCKLFNSMGTMVREANLTTSGQKLWIADLPDGIYVIKIADLSQKIIIQR